MSLKLTRYGSSMGLRTTSVSFALMVGVATLPAQTAARAAIDWGSGAIKINSSLIDLESQQIVGESLLSDYVLLDLTEDVANLGSIGPEMAQKGMTILAGLKEQTLAAAAEAGFSEVEFSGVATAAFRKASNGHELLDHVTQELGIPFQILSQEAEGRLGYLTAMALYPTVPRQSLVAYDSGNGSFQITAQGQDGLHT